LGQKLGSNSCPLFTMLTKQKFLNVLHSKLIKKTKGLLGLLSNPLISELCLFFSFLFFSLSLLLFSFSFWVNLRSYLAISFNQNQNRCVAQSTWNLIRRFPLTKAKLYAWLG
jgi:hypothetical protein